MFACKGAIQQQCSETHFHDFLGVSTVSQGKTVALNRRDGKQNHL